MHGNIQNSCETLKSHLRSINYGKVPTINDFASYNPAIFLQIIHHMLLDYSSTVYEYIVQKDYELYSKNDQRFMECVYKFLLHEFNMKPNITLKQFFTDGYLESKLNLCISIVSVIKDLEAKLEKKPSKPKAASIGTGTGKIKSFAAGNKDNVRVERAPFYDNNVSSPAERIFKSEMNEDVKPYDSVGYNSVPKKDREVLAPISPNIDEPNFENLNLEDITPMSQLPVKPVMLNEFDTIGNQENLSRYANQNSRAQAKASDNYLGKQYIDEKSTPVAPAKPDQTKEILKMIVSMNDAFMSLTKKFESFQTNVEGWMKNTNAQLMLLETNFKVLKGQVAAKNRVTSETE